MAICKACGERFDARAEIERAEGRRERIAHLNRDPDEARRVHARRLGLLSIMEEIAGRCGTERALTYCEKKPEPAERTR